MRSSLYAITVLVLAASPLFAQGRLQRVRDEVRPPEELPKEEAAPEDKDEDDDWGFLSGLLSDEDGGALYGLLWTGLTAPFWLPQHAIGDSLNHDGYFPRYPYRD